MLPVPASAINNGFAIVRAARLCPRTHKGLPYWYGCRRQPSGLRTGWERDGYSNLATCRVRCEAPAERKRVDEPPWQCAQLGLSGVPSNERELRQPSRPTQLLQVVTHRKCRTAPRVPHVQSTTASRSAQHWQQPQKAVPPTHGSASGQSSAFSYDVVCCGWLTMDPVEVFRWALRSELC